MLADEGHERPDPSVHGQGGDELDARTARREPSALSDSGLESRDGATFFSLLRSVPLLSPYSQRRWLLGERAISATQRG